jgi:sulfhydrogenase subunit beta (sulfur reductase)
VQVLDRASLDDLFQALRQRGLRVIGPTVAGGAIVLAELEGSEDLPAGWTDEQDGGTYRLRRRDDEALFGYAVGPHSLKGHLLPPELRLLRARREGPGGFEVLAETAEAPRFAFIGVRSCDLHAMGIQDQVLMGGAFEDPDYAARRRGAFVVAVNCGQAGGTCFCVSMDTGPRCTEGFDLALTEVLDGDGHRFTVEVGSDEGAEVMAELPARDATPAESGAPDAAAERAAAQMGREMEAGDLQELLQANLEHPRWDEVAERCLTCGNCTSVCPTCFCTTVDDVTDLTGQEAERNRRWDSCFTLDFTYVHGGEVRSSNRSRYRQWMTHKLSTWFDQFGTSGCVGCGRCITWCPVAIDITEEVAAIRATPGERRDRAADTG